MVSSLSRYNISFMNHRDGSGKRHFCEYLAVEKNSRHSFLLADKNVVN